MRNCKKCGNVIPEGNDFCSNCGTKYNKVGWGLTILISIGIIIVYWFLPFIVGAAININNYPGSVDSVSNPESYALMELIEFICRFFQIIIPFFIIFGGFFVIHLIRSKCSTNVKRILGIVLIIFTVLFITLTIVSKVSLGDRTINNNKDAYKLDYNLNL